MTYPATVWKSPIPHKLVPTDDSESFRNFAPGETGLPIFPHKGAFAVPRQFHVHEGIDLYVPENTLVSAVEDGRLVGVEPFTGEIAGTPWWENTWAVLVEGISGVVVYGEVVPNATMMSFPDDPIRQGDPVGYVKRVLKTYKGRPMSMLHLELHTHGTRTTYAWEGRFPPPSLRDPTPFLLEADA
jgi:hypothetical protein